MGLLGLESLKLFLLAKSISQAAPLFRLNFVGLIQSWDNFDPKTTLRDYFSSHNNFLGSVGSHNNFLGLLGSYTCFGIIRVPQSFVRPVWSIEIILGLDYSQNDMWEWPNQYNFAFLASYSVRQEREWMSNRSKLYKITKNRNVQVILEEKKTKI